MVDWLNSGVEYWHWLALGLLLVGLEMVVPSFVLIWLGASAFVVGFLMLVLPISFAMQLVIWGVLSILSLILWFKYVAPKMKDKTYSGMALEALFGKVGTVLDYNADSSRGRLRFPAPLLGEDEWRFICEEKLTAGDKVSVVDISGNDLIVKTY